MGINSNRPWAPKGHLTAKSEEEISPLSSTSIHLLVKLSSAWECFSKAQNYDSVAIKV